MAAWLLQIGGAPAPEDTQFEAPPSAVAWLLNDSAPVPLAMEFAAPAVPWTEHDWLAPLGYQMAAQGGGPGPALRARTLLGVGT